MANFLMHSWTSRSNRDGRLGISVIQIPDNDSDPDSVASALPDGYYSLNKYSAAVLVNIMFFLQCVRPIANAIVSLKFFYMVYLGKAKQSQEIAAHKFLQESTPRCLLSAYECSSKTKEQPNGYY
jgi:hypothetical protein